MADGVVECLSHLGVDRRCRLVFRPEPVEVIQSVIVIGIVLIGEHHVCLAYLNECEIGVFRHRIRGDDFVKLGDNGFNRGLLVVRVLGYLRRVKLRGDGIILVIGERAGGIGEIAARCDFGVVTDAGRINGALIMLDCHLVEPNALCLLQVSFGAGVIVFIADIDECIGGIDAVRVFRGECFVGGEQSVIPALFGFFVAGFFGGFGEELATG